jgi:hypothetical protein
LKHLPHRIVMDIMYPMAWQMVVKLRPGIGSLMLFSVNIMSDAVDHTAERFHELMIVEIDRYVNEHINEASEAIDSLFPEDEWQSGE